MGWGAKKVHPHSTFDNDHSHAENDNDFHETIPAAPLGIGLRPFDFVDPRRSGMFVLGGTLAAISVLGQ